MREISLESVDKVIERTGVTYGEAKEALEYTDGEILDAIIYLENKNNKDDKVTESVDEFKSWLKELIRKGNVSRIIIKKDDKTIVDVPVNAGVAVGVMSIIMPAILAFGVIAAVATKITIEITRTDGSVEVVNKYISKAAIEVKEKATNFAESIREKVNEARGNSNTTNIKKESSNNGIDDEKVFSYTVKFDEVKDESQEEKKKDEEN
ncbi:DUF4342 domain-containing protein [uncultured Clostridium sp.]|uniref:DUF4342 domain-containing protein n=1 Tax=uncultured Clostridium sp. TaxID=59620 RepID=UPI0025CF1393|nr:DUF4342 domain-containing protein [uncultured Clostridium sp.]